MSERAPTLGETAAGAMSATEFGTRLGQSLPTADSVSIDELALVDAARTLLDAVMRTGLDDSERGRLAKVIAEVTSELRSRSRDDLVRLVRHSDGRIENLAQAAAGRCNPRSLRLQFDDPWPQTPPPAGMLDAAADAEVDAAAEVRGRCILDASASGPPERAHGGIVTTILDEALGMAISRAGRTGMTAAIEVSFRGPVPLDVELIVTSRVVRIEGRKTFAEAEIHVGDAVAARATGLFVASRGAS